MQRFQKILQIVGSYSGLNYVQELFSGIRFIFKWQGIYGLNIKTIS